MEKTPDYFTHWTNPEHMKQMISDVKLILVLDEPACRIVSDFFFERRNGFHHFHHNLSIEEFMASEEHARKRWLVFQPSFYDDNMESWLKFFPLGA
jgi:hypothetical protein